MQPEDYQRLPNQQMPSFAALGGQMHAEAAALGRVNETVAPPQGELTRIYERLSQFHSRICDSRDSLIKLNERVGVSHLPQSGNEKPPEPPHAEGMLPAIDSFLQLIDESLHGLSYQIERIKLL
jgi:hypothetical protein